MSLSCKLLNATIASSCSISEGNHLNHVTCKKKSYMVRDDFSHYLVEVDSLISYLQNQTNISLNKPPFGNLIDGFVSLVGPLPSIDEKNSSMLVHSLNLFSFMCTVAKDNTYLFTDYKNECVILSLLIIAFVHELDSLLFYKVQSLPSAITFDPLNQNLEEFALSTDARALLVESKTSNISYEHSFAIGHLLFSKYILSVFAYLKDNDAYDLALRLLQYKSTDPLYKVFLKAHDLTLQRIEHDKSELFEPLRPSFEGVGPAPANWFELDSYLSLTPVYDKDRLALIDMHKQVDMAYCLSRKWAIDLLKLQQIVNEQLQKTIELKEKLKDREKQDKFKDKRDQLKNAFVDDLKNNQSIKKEGAKLDNVSTDNVSTIPPLLETIESNLNSECTSDLNIDDKLTDNVIEEKILESNTSYYPNDENALNDVIFSSEAINNRYCFEHQIHSITVSSDDDDKDIKAFKTIIKKLIDISSDNCEIKKELDKRTKRFKQVLEVILGFVKDGSFLIDYDLDNALKNAQSFNDLFITVLATYHASMSNYKENKVGVSYLNKFVKAEVKRFSSL